MVIPKERLAGYRRWQVNSFDKPPDIAPQSSKNSPTLQENIDDKTSGTITETIVDMPFPTAEQLERISEEAHAEGYQAGYDEGRSVAEAEFSRLTNEQISQFSELIGNLQVALAHLDQEIGEQLLDLSLEVAAQVLRTSLVTNRDLLLPVVREALAELPFHHGAISLHLNPTDAEALHETLKDQLAHTSAHLVSDSNISPGGCYLKAGSSEIDATIETRWRRVLEAIGIKAKEWLKNP